MANYKKRTAEDWEKLSFKGMVDELNEKFGSTYVEFVNPLEEESKEEEFKDFFNAKLES